MCLGLGHLQRGLELLAMLPDDVALRLVHLLASQPSGEVVPLLAATSRLSPAASRRVLRALGPLVRSARPRGG